MITGCLLCCLLGPAAYLPPAFPPPLWGSAGHSEGKVTKQVSEQAALLCSPGLWATGKQGSMLGGSMPPSRWLGSSLLSPPLSLPPGVLAVPLSTPKPGLVFSLHKPH